jgi:hypothetical protein
MFIGHVAIALAAKRVRQSVPLAALLAASFGPDVIEITLLVLERWRNLPTSLGSHSIPAVALGGAVFGAGYWLRREDGRGGALLFGVYASHWAADLLTGSGKPTWLGGPKLGLSLYDYPALDFVVESGMMLVAWLLFWPGGDRRPRPRTVRMAAPIALVLVQLAFNAAEWLFGVRSIKGAVSGAPGRGDASSAAISRTAGRRGGCDARLAACLLHGLRSPPFIERAMADNSGPRGVVTLVCLTCGKEKFYEQAAPPPDVTCDQCGGTVFRQFATPTEPDEATIVTLEEQARSIAYGDSSPDTATDDVRDLDHR